MAQTLRDSAVMSVDDRLESNPVFAHLTAAERARVVSASPLRSFGARETVLVDGDPCTHVHVLLSGSVRVFHSSSNGTEVVVKIFKPPALFGEMEGIVGRPYGESVSALEDSELLLVPREVFVRLIDDNHDFARGLLHHVCSCFCIASHTEKAMAFDTVRAQLAHFLSTYSTFDGVETPQGVVLRLPITQDDMADALGVTRRAVAKEIARWRAQGIIQRRDGHYVVLRPDSLAEEAGDARLPLTYAMDRDVSEH